MNPFKSIETFFDWLVTDIRRFGIEKMFKRYYGTYRAVVKDNADPESRGRVRLAVPILGQTDAPNNVWAEPMFPGAANKHGLFFAPEPADQVWVQFIAGDPSRPIYTGGFIAKNQAPSEFSASPSRRGIKTPSGHYILFSDEDGTENVTIVSKEGGQIQLDQNGSAIIANKDGSFLYLNADSDETTLSDSTGSSVSIVNGKISVIAADGAMISVSDGITIVSQKAITLNASSAVNIKSGTVKLGDSAASSVPLGEALLAWLNTHTHLDATTAPTLPPTVPATPAVLSTRVKTA